MVLACFVEEFVPLSAACPDKDDDDRRPTAQKPSDGDATSPVVSVSAGPEPDAPGDPCDVAHPPRYDGYSYENAR